MTRAADRLRLMTMLQEAVAGGVQQREACQCVGISERTFKRWQQSPDDRRPTTPRPVPKNKLSAEEEQQVLAICHQPGSPACRRRKSCRSWPMRAAISPANRRFIGYCVVPAKSRGEAVSRRRKANRCRPGRRLALTRCGRGISPG